jgi:hypothetical protein
MKLQCLLGKIPISFRPLDRSRRHRNMLRTPATRTALKQNSLYYMALKIYNKLPGHLNNVNLAGFRNKLLILLAAKAYYKLTEFFMDKL